MSQNLLFDAPGPRGRRRARVMNVVGLIVIAACAAWIITALAAKDQLTAEKWLPFLSQPTWTVYLLPGLGSTLKAAAVAMICAIVFGLVFGIARLSRFRVIRAISTVVVEFFRAVPVLILMIFFWYLLSFGRIVSAQVSPFIAVVIGLALYNGSVIAEVVRSAVENLPRGQKEAGLAIGLRPRQVLNLIELPQALAAMMPALVAQLIVVLKDTALGYIVTYPELLRQARLVGTANGNLIPTLMVVAVIFIIVNYSLGRLAEFAGSRMERRTAASVKQRVEASAALLDD
ncbi:MAG: ABC transmembrane type-1 domain-containing protein [Pseudoclavibacter caeni]|jgi:glutamate transport system permease protein